MKHHAVIACLLAGMVASYGSSSVLPTTVSSVTVCEAIREPVGKRIRVEGEFNGFTYDTRSTRFLISTTGVCTSEGSRQCLGRVVGRLRA